VCESRVRRYLAEGVDRPILRELDVVGAEHRAGARCPVCWAGSRTRLVWLYLQRVSGLLDYAHAPGLVQLDLLALPYPEATFDAILANHVLEHVEDDRAAMSEILRALRPGGLALLQVPIALGLKTTREDPAARTPEARERVHGQRDHVRLYANDYPDRLRAVGFEVHAWRPEASAVESFDLNPRECLFVARRPRPQALARKAA
jgi:SAM-dependent methyltransferase